MTDTAKLTCEVCGLTDANVRHVGFYAGCSSDQPMPYTEQHDIHYYDDNDYRETHPCIDALRTELATLHARCAQYEAVVGAAVTFVEVVDPPKTDNYREYRIASDALIAAVQALAAHLAGSICALAATTTEGDTNV